MTCRGTAGSAGREGRAVTAADLLPRAASFVSVRDVGFRSRRFSGESLPNGARHRG